MDDRFKKTTEPSTIKNLKVDLTFQPLSLKSVHLNFYSLKNFQTLIHFWHISGELENSQKSTNKKKGGTLLMSLITDPSHLFFRKQWKR